MMKALNKEHTRHEAAARNPFWVELFSRLERLVKLQLVVCPTSDVHSYESMVSKDGESLRRMSDQLSRGVSFHPTSTIAQRQANVALLAWLRGERAEYGCDPESATNGGLNDWKDSLIISVSGGYPRFLVEGIRKARNEIYEKIRVLFQEEVPKVDEQGFVYWMQREQRGAARGIVQAAQLYADRLREMAAGQVPFAFDSLYTSEGLDHYRLIMEVLTRQSIPESERPARLVEFLKSETFLEYPSNRITILLWAALCRAAAGGQRQPPNAGTSNDFSVLTLLPYCDAMFVDNGCRALWEKIPGQYRPKYKGRLFSYTTREEFLAYLRDIEETADPAILASARDVHGEPSPYLTMYEYRG